MKKIILLLLTVVALYSCGDDMFDSIKEHVAEETVYPAQFDFAQAKVGFERVEIDLMKVGRVPSSRIHLTKAQKTVVEYSDQEIVIDSVCSWVNVTGLTNPGMYRFKIYTMDEYGNKSIPQEVSCVPFTSTDKEVLAVTAPKFLASTSTVVVEWTKGLSSVLFTYYGLTYTYTDKDGVVHNEQTTASKFTVENLEGGQPVTVNVSYKVIPKKETVAILDTVWFDAPLTVKALTEEEFNTIKNSYKNRGISSLEYKGGNTATIKWEASNKDLLYTDIQYPTNDGTTAEIRIQPNQNQTVLANAAPDISAYKYRSSFSYEGMEFSLDWQGYQFPKVPVYLIGDATPAAWSLTKAIELPFNPENPGVYVWEGKLTAGNFWFLSGRVWTGTQYGALSPDLPLEGSGIIQLSTDPYAWTLTSAQTGAQCRITLDLNQMRVSVEKY
ncbi:hypothetical protein FACS1894162_1610 [Bacteroidia bacterium]|nr:hypothetical protein FACS1894162_1610 [Bacteroidia bacterium]